MLDWESIFATRSSRMKASEIRELLKLLDRPDIISFAGGIPDPELFPNDAFREAYAEIFDGPSVGAALQYSVSEGYRPLRRVAPGRWSHLHSGERRQHLHHLRVAAGARTISQAVSVAERHGARHLGDRI